MSIHIGLLSRKTTKEQEKEIDDEKRKKLNVNFFLLLVDETKYENLRNSQGFDEFITEFAGKT